MGSKVGGIVEQIADEQLMFEPGSVEGLAGALEYACHNYNKLRIPKVSHIDQMADATEEVYRELVKECQGR